MAAQVEGDHTAGQIIAPKSTRTREFALAKAQFISVGKTPDVPIHLLGVGPNHSNEGVLLTVGTKKREGRFSARAAVPAPALKPLKLGASLSRGWRGGMADPRLFIHSWRPIDDGTLADKES